MALTKLEALKLAEPIEAAYMDCSTQLILNISRHFATGRGLATAEWQIKKLSEINSLTEESIEIIAANTGHLKDDIREVYKDVLGVGLKDTERILQAAARAGYLPSRPSIEESLAMQNLIQAYVAQAEDTFNLVNTVMLESTLYRYRHVIDDVARIERLQGISSEGDLIRQMTHTQGVLNVSTASVITGAETRTQALRSAISDLASHGITGWVDRGGHEWSAEAYINMDIRTTAHNVAVEAQKERSAEYGVSTFQISTHAGARPLCALYQGWICSWDGSGGTVHDLYGNEYQVHSINDTSYGEAAGIFGINCGHFPETFVDGFSVPRYEELTPEQEAENALQYKQSQQQRELEREIRYAKTKAAALEASGDPKGFHDASVKVKQKQNEYKQFCIQTGRTPRPDRTQVYAYNRSVAGKVNWENRKPSTPKSVQSYKPVKVGQKGYSAALSSLERAGVKAKKVEKFKSQPTHEEIVARLGGGDLTHGSCSSLAFAYGGNANGYDVRDFRGGASEKWFARNDHIGMVVRELGGTIVEDGNDYTASHTLLDKVQKGRIYYFATGSHAAVVRKNGDKLEYLELQAPSGNGWYALTDDALKWRFGAKKSHTSAGRPYKLPNFLADMTKIKSKNFPKILQYINTDEAKQKKGGAGGRK